MRNDHKTLAGIWLGSETEKFGTKWVLRLQPPSGLAGDPRFCHLPLVYLWHRRKQGTRKGRKGKIQIAEVVLSSSPSNESTQLLTERLNPFFFWASGAEHGAREAPGVCSAWLPTKPTAKLPHFKGNWIRPVSGAFQRLILKSFVLITLPEGKQRVRAVYPHRHRSLSKGAEPGWAPHVSLPSE